MPDSTSENPTPDEPQGDLSTAPISARWLRLCEGADQLEDAVFRFAEGGESPLQAAVSYLENVLEAFPQPDDPSQDIKSFAIHKLAHSVYEAVVAGGALIPKPSDP